MLVLALDIANHLGWSHNFSRSIRYGDEDFSPTRWESSGMRYLKFNRWLTDITKDQGALLVAYEKVESHSSTYAAHVFGGYVATLQAFCEEKSFDYCGFGVKTIKKNWVGKGTASKDDMVRVAREKGFNPPSHDCADSLAVLHLALETYDRL